MKIGNLECYGIIYKITNKINGKVYIGQTINGFDMRYRHNLIDYTHNEHLKNSIKKYGIKNFKINKIFDIAFSKKELDIKEQSWISIYKSFNRKYGYNKDNGGSRGIPTLETRIKMGRASKERWKNPNYKNKMKKIISNTHWNSSKNNNPMCKKVILLNTLEKFDYGKLASKKYNCNYTHLMECCRGERLSCGRNIVTKEKLVWMFYEDYIKKDSEEINNKIHKANTANKGKNNHWYKKGYLFIGKNNPNYNNGLKIKGCLNPNSKKVICLNTQKLFNTIADASEYYNIKNRSNISSCCKGKRNHCGKLEDGTKLQWMYYEDYIKEQQNLIPAI